MFVTAINNSEVQDVAQEEIEPKIISAVNELDSKNNLGFEDVSYENNIITFKVSDPTKSISSSASTVKAIFESMLDEINKDVEIEYEVKGETGNLRDLKDNEEKLFALARKVLKSISSDGKLLLSSMVGNSLTAKLSLTHNGITTH
jgi:hypothetical protein